MSYYHIKKKELLQKAKERQSKEKAAEYYSKNKGAMQKDSKDRYKNLSKEEQGGKIKEYQRKRYQKLIQYNKETLENK